MTTILISALPAAAALLAVIVTVGRWVGRVDENTRATEKLTLTFEKSGTVLLDHEKRITRLEDHDE
jgi:hypothetical protein